MITQTVWIDELYGLISGEQALLSSMRHKSEQSAHCEEWQEGSVIAINIKAYRLDPRCR